MEVYGAPINRRLLEEFASNHLEGFVLSISSNDLAKLESSVNFLEIVQKGAGGGHQLLKAKLGPIKIPNACYPIYMVNEVNGVATASDTGNSPMAETKCFHSNRFYDDGEQWRSSSESCTICTCNNQRTKCDPIKCAPLRCRKEEQVQKKGDCCPTCVGE